MNHLLRLQDLYTQTGQPQPPDRDIGHFNIFRLEELYFPGKNPKPPARRDFFKVSLVAGASKMHYAGCTVEVQDYAVVFTNPVIPYQWERITERQAGFMCVFTEQFVTPYGQLAGYPVFKTPSQAIIRLTPGAFAQYEARFLRMYEVIQSDYAYKYDFLRGLLLELIHEFQQQLAIPPAVPGANAYERITAAFTGLLERQFPVDTDHPGIQLHVPSAYAARLNIHVNHLNKALRSTTGQTTSQLIGDRLIQEARVLLKTTHQSIAEIAWGLGFKESNHFSGFFKTRTGMTPTQFRSANTD